jgi:hypothetical protein
MNVKLNSYSDNIELTTTKIDKENDCKYFDDLDANDT